MPLTNLQIWVKVHKITEQVFTSLVLVAASKVQYKFDDEDDDDDDEEDGGGGGDNVQNKAESSSDEGGKDSDFNPTVSDDDDDEYSKPPPAAALQSSQFVSDSFAGFCLQILCTVLIKNSLII